MSGHSKWSSIKHKKGAADAKRGKLFSKLSRAIIVAAREGGPDPDANATLATAIQKARDNSMPKENIERAIQRGAGSGEGESYESILYEGYAPGGVALLIDALTNNRSRTAPDLRSIFEKNGGNLANSGAVAFQFTKQGVITIKSDAITEDALLEAALDAGAEDVRNEGEVFEVITSPTAYLKVKEALTAAKIPVEASEITHMPNSTIAVDGEAAQKLLKLIDALEDNDDVQSVSHNAEIPDSVTV